MSGHSPPRGLDVRKRDWVTRGRWNVTKTRHYRNERRAKRGWGNASIIQHDDVTVSRTRPRITRLNRRTSCCFNPICLSACLFVHQIHFTVRHWHSKWAGTARLSISYSTNSSPCTHTCSHISKTSARKHNVTGLYMCLSTEQNTFIYDNWCRRNLARSCAQSIRWCHREGLSVIRDSVWSCFVQKVQLSFFTMF